MQHLDSNYCTKNGGDGVPTDFAHKHGLGMMITLQLLQDAAVRNLKEMIKASLIS